MTCLHDGTASATSAPVAPADRPASLTVFAAGSLRRALTEVAQAFEQEGEGRRVGFRFGASGLLMDRLAAGEAADLFASANLSHPQALCDAGRARGNVRCFARNRLCALVREDVDVTPQTLVERMLDPAIRLGTSTPGADPAGDYARAMFEQVERCGHPGAARALAAKALALTGGPGSVKPASGKNVYGVLVAEGQADIFLTYPTNAAVALREQPSLRVVRVPDAINPSVDYGIAALDGASPQAEAFVERLLGPEGQAVLLRHGFALP